MNSLEDVTDFHMSGRRSVFTLRPGAKIDRDAVAEAYESNGLKLESLNLEHRDRAQTYYVADAGIT